MLLEYVDGDCPPQDGRVVGDDEDDDFPLREGSSPGGIAPLEGKSAPASSASRRRRSVPKVLSLFFYRSKDLIYTKMGTEGGPGWPPPTRARLGA